MIMCSPKNMSNMNARHKCIINFLLVKAYEIISNKSMCTFISDLPVTHSSTLCHSPLVHCMSMLEFPQQPHSLLFPQWPPSPDPGQQSKQQSCSFPRLWICTPTSRPAITASKPTTTSFSPSGYTNTPG